MRLVPVVAVTLLGLLAALTPAAADSPGAAPFPGEEILLWPGDAPGSEGLSLEETMTERSADPGLRRVVAKYPLERGASSDWPPTFLLHAADDATVSAAGSVRLFLALRASGVPAEIHVFESGGHGFGIRNAEGPVALWPELCGEWMRHLGVLREAGDRVFP